MSLLTHLFAPDRASLYSLIEVRKIYATELLAQFDADCLYGSVIRHYPVLSWELITYRW